jgi:hypothetical protein
MEFVAIPTRDTGGLLPPVLERVKAQRDHCRRRKGSGYTENAALLAQLVVIERMCGEHDPLGSTATH